MKQVSIPSSTGGTIVETYTEEGVRVKVIHTSGKAYSGKTAEAEAKVKQGKKK